MKDIEDKKGYGEVYQREFQIFRYPRCSLPALLEKTVPQDEKRESLREEIRLPERSEFNGF